MIVGLTALLSTLHHGWEEFHTEQPLYVSGTVTAVRWGNPHPEVQLRVSAPVRLPAGLAQRSIPAELEALGGRDVLGRTQPFEGPADEVVLVLAPVERLSAWGMPDRVAQGERLEAVGYVSREHASEFRPELLVRQDGRAIRQRSVPLPDVPPPAPTPVGPSEQGGSPDSADGTSDGSVSGPLPWLVAGAVLVAGGAVVAVRAMRRRDT
ncbi:hypothetical protein [Nonomuraea sp. CA-141351]|uniref:hypothetical protein n=1 Tax=Nonomuraea sp. CA-141351 TaxID=3239996 RepID=UPI003D94651E